MDYKILKAHRTTCENEYDESLRILLHAVLLFITYRCLSGTVVGMYKKKNRELFVEVRGSAKPIITNKKARGMSRAFLLSFVIMLKFADFVLTKEKRKRYIMFVLKSLLLTFFFLLIGIDVL